MKILIFLFLILLILSYFTKEHFTSLIYNVDIIKNIHLIYLNNSNFNLTKYIDKLINIKTTNNINENYNSYITCSFEYFNLNNNEPIISVLPFKKQLLLISKFKDENIDSLLSTTTEIICQNTNCVELIKFIINIFDYNIDNYKFIINPNISQNIIDKYKLIITYDTLDNLKILLSNFIFNVISTENFSLNIHKQKVLIPFIQTQNYDMRIYFPKILSKFSVKSVFEFDTILVCSKNCNINLIQDQIKLLILNFNQLDKNNYYSKYFKLHFLTKNILKNYNKFITNRDTLSILEQFENLPNLDFNKNINGFYDNDNNKFIINNNYIDNIPIIKNQIINLTNQNRNEENGTYNVYDINTNTILIKNDINIPKDDNFDPRYVCTDTNYSIKGLCESDFNELGELKKYKTYWDRPCETNTECPFYQKNKNYKNYRGGCIDGYCELPIGINRLSYRKYDNNSKPYCHNCKNKLIGKCCNKQKNPDYAFELDEFERN